MTENDKKKLASPEQIKYANLLFYGSWSGIFVMVVTYLIYVFGILDPHIPVEIIPQLWGLSSSEFSHETGVPLGWGWFSLIGKGDYLNFIGIAFLGVLTIIGYLMLIPTYAKAKDKAFLTIVVLEIIVLSVAASGILGSGGH